MKSMNFSVALFLLLAAVQAPAETITYSQRQTYYQETGQRIVDTFENPNYEHVMSDAAMSAVLGETQYYTYGGNIVDYNNVMPGFGVGKSKGYCSLCYGSFRLSFQSSSITVNGGVFGVGVDVTENNGAIHPDRYTAKVTLVGGEIEMHSLPYVASAFPAAPSHQFWGITSEAGILSVDFLSHSSVGPDRTYLIIDNLTISAAPIPEQSTLILMLTGLWFISMSARATRQEASRVERARVRDAAPLAQLARCGRRR